MDTKYNFDNICDDRDDRYDFFLEKPMAKWPETCSVFG